MNANPKFLAATAHVDDAAVKPLPNSRKVYVEGSRPDLRVPMREIALAPTRSANSQVEANEPVRSELARWPAASVPVREL